ncbi:MAG: ATP-binding cassette domain-containing protein [Chitinophagia bacterium]
MEPLLSLSHLVKHYATQKAVDDISFDIQKGSIFGLLGPNGAGKTTLLRMITGIFYPDSGTITLDGKHFDPLLDIREIGYMPEERGLYKKMKIGEQALYLAQLRGLSKADAMVKIKYWFEKFEMQSWWNKKVEDLSKGMSQKLQFVITVLHEPKLIILDEPFSGLDPLNANLIKDEIYGLAKKGATIIFSTHRMEQVEEICDHIVLVNLGKKILDGSVADIKQQFKASIFAVETSQPAWIKDNALFNVLDKADKNPNKILIKLSQGIASNEVLKYLIEQNIPVISYNEVLPSLNDIFIQLVEDTHAKARAFQQI